MPWVVIQSVPVAVDERIWPAVPTSLFISVKVLFSSTSPLASKGPFSVVVPATVRSLASVAAPVNVVVPVTARLPPTVAAPVVLDVAEPTLPTAVTFPAAVKSVPSFWRAVDSTQALFVLSQRQVFPSAVPTAGAVSSIQNATKDGVGRL